MSFLLWLALWAGTQSGAAAHAGCLDRILAYLPVRHAANFRGFDGAVYERKRVEWTGGLAAASGADAKRALVAAALEAGTLGSPESLFALLDALNPRADAGFHAQLRAIQAHGVGIVLRNYRFPYGWTPSGTVEDGGGSPRSPTVREKRAGRRFKLFPPFYTRGTKLLEIAFPDVPARTPDELLQLVYHYSAALAVHRLDLVARASPILSTPVGPAGWSHPERVMAELQKVEEHLYLTLAALAELFPDVELPIPEKDGVWRWRWAQLTKDALFGVLFPIYRPMGVFRPSRAGYEAFLAGPEPARARGETQYRWRLRLGWLIDRWRNLLVAAALVGAWDTAHTGYDFVASGAAWRYLQEPTRIQQTYTPERLNHAVEEYGRDPGGFAPVNDHYNAQIRALEEKIRKDGDPQGKLRRQIQELERRRDFLKN